MEGGPSIQQRDDAMNSTEEETNKGCCYSFCDPRGTLHRFVALFFMCFLGFGSYFCYDNPGALKDHMQQDLNITATQYTLFYSMYSWPNVVLCFVGGFLIDSVLGIRLGSNLYMGFTFLGQLLFAWGAYVDLFWLMVLGRFIFGIGAESLAVAQNSYTVLWFKGKELNMVFGLQLSFARIGSTVNFLVMENVYEWITEKYKGYEGLGIVLLVATLTCVFSMICSLILGFMDKRAERILQRNQTERAEAVKLKDIADFKPSFWMISLICVSYYIAIFPFIALGKDFFIHKFHMNDKHADRISSLIYFISGLAAPLFGFAIDKIGKNLSWIAIAILATIGAHSLLAFSSLNPYFGVVLMGLSYSCLAGSLWPLVALIIPEYQLGTAYGVCQAVQNLGLAVFTIVAGNIEEKDGYTWLEIFFISSLLVALLCTIMLWLLDIWQKGTLNMTPGLRRKRQEEEAADAESERLLADQGQERLQPSSDFEIRNRYLSRIGAPLPDHYSIQNKEVVYRALR